MNGMKRLRLGLAVGAAALLALLATSQVSASTENIEVSRVTVTPGLEGTVTLAATGIHEPGLGAWEIGILYNPSVVEAVSCQALNGSVCNPDYANNQVRVTGASASGLVDDNDLARITFRCDNSEGTSPLTLTIAVVADATVGEPQPLDVKVFNGAVTCTQSPFSTPPPGPTPSEQQPTSAPPSPTQAPPVLPQTGMGGGSGGGTFSWVIASLAAFGLIATAGFGLITIRTRR